MLFVYVSTHAFEFPIDTIIAWIIKDYHEQGNIIITILLLPLGHISTVHVIAVHRHDLVLLGKKLGHGFGLIGKDSSLLNCRLAQPLVLEQLQLLLLLSCLLLGQFFLCLQCLRQHQLI